MSSIDGTEKEDDRDNLEANVVDITSTNRSPGALPG